MKRALIALAVGLLCACGSSGSNTTGGGGGNNGGGTGTGGGGTTGGADMAASTGNDAGMTLPPDMQPAYGCNSLNTCIDGCTSFSCYQTCNASATQHARQLYQKALGCIRQECFTVPDGGAAPCTQGGGTPSADCTQCEDDSIKMAGSCGNDTQYCGTCYAQYAACLADTP